MQEQNIYDFYLAAIILGLAFVFFIVVYVVIYRQRQNSFYFEKQRLAVEHRNELLTAKIAEQERMLNRLSRELHDNLGQSLSFIKMSMTVISRHMSENAPADLIGNTHRMLDKVIGDIHNVSHVLNSNYIKQQGLSELLQLELEHLQLMPAVQCALEVNGAIKILHPEKELLIYRIAQEAIHNIAKHAAATRIDIRLNFEQDFIMEIADNGKGFEMKDVSTGTGIGIQNMKDRAALLNGTIAFRTEIDMGSTVILTIPAVNRD